MDEQEYNQQNAMQRVIIKDGLDGLNRIADARQQAGYGSHKRLNAFVVLGHFLLDTCGNVLKAQWSKGKWKKLEGHTIPLVATLDQWNNILADRGVESMTYALGNCIPPVGMVCDICGKEWTLATCHEPMVVREQDDVVLTKWEGNTLREVEDILSKEMKGLVFFQPDLVLKNIAYIGLRHHPKYHNVEIRDGWVREVNKEEYVVQWGDVGMVNVWHYRHPQCQRQLIAKRDKEAFFQAFGKAGYTGVNFEEIPNEYNEYWEGNEDCPPWYIVSTKQGNFKVGWRKRVIHLQWAGDGVGPTRDVNDLFEGEAVTLSGNYIHAWGYEKMVDYLKLLLR